MWECGFWQPWCNRGDKTIFVIQEMLAVALTGCSERRYLYSTVFKTTIINQFLTLRLKNHTKTEKMSYLWLFFLSSSLPKSCKTDTKHDESLNHDIHELSLRDRKTSNTVTEIHTPTASFQTSQCDITVSLSL